MKNLLKKLKQKREERELLLGEKIWNDLTETLPEAVGVITDDTPRVNQFAAKVKKLNKKSQQAIKNG